MLSYSSYFVKIYNLLIWSCKNSTFYKTAQISQIGFIKPQVRAIQNPLKTGQLRPVRYTLLQAKTKARKEGYVQIAELFEEKFDYDDMYDSADEE